MLLLITFIDIVYGIDCKRVMCGVYCGINKLEIGLLFTNI